VLVKSLEGGTEGFVPALEPLLAGAYAEYGWDLETGRPRPETLEDLDLDDL
jgi:aldehyde:ferredoxin oxidoreductase